MASGTLTAGGADLGSDLHGWTATLYLIASVAATLGLAQRSARFERIALGALGIGAAVHGLAFLQLHGRDPTPSLTTLAAAISLAAWIGTLFFLAIQRHARLGSLAVVVAPVAFLCVFAATLRLPGAAAAPTGSPVWSHAHVLLASAGMALLGVAGAAGLLYVVHHRRIKAKREPGTGLPLPPLEALDRANVFSLSVGFLLLSLGVVTGVLWVRSSQGRWWPGSAHANATLVAWAIYFLLVASRFVAHQGGRRSALAALAGFVVLLVAVFGVGLLS